MARFEAVARVMLPCSVVGLLVLAGCGGTPTERTPAPVTSPAASSTTPARPAETPAAEPAPSVGGSAVPTPEPGGSGADGETGEGETGAGETGRTAGAGPTSEQVRAAMDCLQGRWTMTAFAIESDRAVTTEGVGGDVTFSFDDDRWELFGGGQQPVTISIGQREAEVSVSGWAEGAMSPEPDGVRYELAESDGSVEMTVPDGSQEHAIPLKHFLATMVPSGTTGIDCDQESARISSLNVSVNQVLTLQR